MSAPKLRLVRVLVHPILMLDDGETLAPFENYPSEIPANEFASYPEKLLADIAEVQAQLDEQAAASAPNRAQRRAAPKRPRRAAPKSGSRPKPKSG